MANTIVTQRDTQLEKQRAGFSMVTLTNFINDDEPTIAAGSVVEISGSLYSVTANESITGWAGMSDGPVWIKAVPSGTDPFTAEYTATAPTWSDAKQGWYDGTGTDRYLVGLTKAGAAGYTSKFLMTAVERGDRHVDGDMFVDGEADIVGDVNTTGDLLASGKLSLDSGGLVLSASTTYGTWTVSAGSTFTIPKGIYVVGHNGKAQIQIHSGSGWVGAGEITGAIISDGSSVGIYGSDVITAPYDAGVVYYRKFV